MLLATVFYFYLILETTFQDHSNIQTDLIQWTQKWLPDVPNAKNLILTKKGSSDYFDFVQVRAYLKESESFRGSKEITFEKTFVLFFLKLIKVNVFLTLSL